MAVERMYERLKSGETIPVRVPETGRIFRIRPEYWERLVLGYSVVEPDGHVPRQCRGLMLEKAEVEAWALLLEEHRPNDF